MDEPPQSKVFPLKVLQDTVPRNWNNVTQLLLRAGLGAVFIWSGGAKLFNPQNFAVIVESFGLIPEAAVFPAALGLAGTEIVAGWGLISNKPWGLILVSAPLMLFIVVLSYGLWLGLDVDCGCFGPQDPEAKATMACVLRSIAIWRC